MKNCARYEASGGYDYAQKVCHRSKLSFHCWHRIARVVVLR